MLIDLNTLAKELPILNEVGVDRLCDDLATLGFPVDEVRDSNSSNIVLDVDVTSNRGDAQSHHGLARDLAIKLDANLASIPYVEIAEGEPVLTIKLEALDVVHMYSTAVLSINPDRSNNVPDAVKVFLASINVGSKELPAVDASNEILHMYGQPTHAFDADLIQGYIVVRWAKDGESIVTIDMAERKLTRKDLIISDRVGPIAMAGLIGGHRTKVSSATRRLLLESAFFNSQTIQAMSYRHSLHTDASQRFGRGTDPAFVVTARNLLVRRLQDWVCASLQSAWTLGSLPPSADFICMPWALLDRVAGYYIDRCEAISLLRRLGCNVCEQNRGLSVQAPSWRHDLTIAVDLVEEILRLKGYKDIPSVLPQLQSAPLELSPDYVKRRNLSNRLANLGFSQTVTMSFVGPKESIVGWQDSSDSQELRTLKNPLSASYSVMRNSLLPDLARVVKLNLERGLREAKFFEIAPVFEAHSDKSISEIWTLGIVWCGESGGNDPLSDVRDISNAEGKSFLMGILKAIGITETVMQSFDNWQMFDHKTVIDRRLGWQFEIPIAMIPDKNWKIIPKFVPFSKFPIMERDLSLIVDVNHQYNALRNAIVAAMNSTGAPLYDLKCVDVFRHKNLPNERQAWLLRLCFQAIDHTLTKEEVDNWIDLAISAVKPFGAELRS